MRSTSPAVWVVGGALGVGALLMGASIALSTMQSAPRSDRAVVVSATYQAPKSAGPSAVQLPNAPVPQRAGGASGPAGTTLPGGRTGGVGGDQTPVTLPPAPTPVLTVAPQPIAPAITFQAARITFAPQLPTAQPAPTTAPTSATPTSATPTSATPTLAPTSPTGTSSPSATQTVVVSLGQSSTATPENLCIPTSPAPRAATPIPGWWPEWLPFPSFSAGPSQAEDGNATRAHGCPDAKVTPSAEVTTAVPAPEAAAPDPTATKTNQGRPNATAQTTRTAPAAPAATRAHGNGPGELGPQPGANANAHSNGNANANANANGEGQPAATRTKAQAAAG
jgi:hypothetical protein